MRLHHVGIAVPSLDEAVATYGRLGLEAVARGRVPAFNVAVCLLDAGAVWLELLAPEGPGAVQTFLDRRGPGLHHTAFAVDDLRAELARLKTAGFRLVDEAPRVGFGGHEVAFLHPQSAHGALIELMQAQREFNQA